MVHDLDPALPPVRCLSDEVSQVFLNLIVNAAHAIEDSPRAGAGGLITITSRLDGDKVEVRVADNGTGIPAAVRHKVFDPFFTTKDVGRGTGQGLPLAHAVVVQRHGGSLRFETEEAAGTTFIVTLPLEPMHESAPAGAEE
jgi:signal transduction histidine kinase